MNANKLLLISEVGVPLTRLIFKGKVKKILYTPNNDGNFLIEMVLPKRLVTSYKKKIQFQQEMRGSADIITEDLRLLERVFYQFRSMYQVE